jgi:hypothetical protein
VTRIEGHAFHSCIKLTSITIPDSVTSIERYAFVGCSGLTTITIPDSVTSIGDSAFQSCTGLTSITIGNSVTSIGSYAFHSCGKVETITCLRSSAPSVQSAAFGNYSASYIGKDVTVTKTLYVPTGATGYDKSDWASILLDSSKCNFVLSATL